MNIRKMLTITGIALNTVTACNNINRPLHSMGQKVIHHRNSALSEVSQLPEINLNQACWDIYETCEIRFSSTGLSCNNLKSMYLCPSGLVRTFNLRAF